MPMVNPDGAEIFKRRNSLSIDLNRDATRLQSSQAQTLMKMFDSIKADFGFNLHDQNHRYTAGNSFKSAAISFLAPPLNYEKQIDAVRLNAIKLIGSLFNMLNKFIPGHIAKYSDDYEPRAFGDTFQKKGTSTILVESGGWQNDSEKQFIRKMNFILLLSAFKQIAENSFDNIPESIYESIPFNEEKLFDVVLRNLTLNKNGNKIKIDIGINFEEILTSDKTSLFKKATILDIGDLSVYFGYTDLDLSGYELSESKTMKAKDFSIKKLNSALLTELFKNGYTNVLSTNKTNDQFTSVPINLITNDKKEFKTRFDIGAVPNFLIKKNDKVEYVVVNGFVQKVNETFDYFGNGLIIK
jgi:hypothetical protein